MRRLPQFSRHVIYSGPPSERTLCVIGDVNHDSVPEIVIGARYPRGALYWLGLNSQGRWETHLMDDDCGPLEAGGTFFRLDPGGQLAFVAGHDGSGDLIQWWEPGSDATQPWARHELFHMPAAKSHDQLAADIDGDGREELYFWNQGAETLFQATVPDDPTAGSWPHVTAVAMGVIEEGLAAGDLDGDGRLELIAGQSWYRLRGEGTWERHEFARGYCSPRVAVADFDGDGRLEIVLSEGDASIFRHAPGRLVRFRARRNLEALWEGEPLRADLLDPHTLQVADFDGDGSPDLLVGELGHPSGKPSRPPAVFVFYNHGGDLHEAKVHEGISIHEGKVIRLGDKIGFVGKPYQNARTGAHRNPEADQIFLWLPD